MFAVPGWAVPAKTLISESPRASKASFRSESDQSSKSSKKRKITHNDETTRKIAGNDLERLWDKSFGSKAHHTSKKLKRQSDNEKENENSKPTGNATTLERDRPDRLSDQSVVGMDLENVGDNSSKEDRQKKKHLHRQERPGRDDKSTTKSTEHLKPPQPAPPPSTAKLTPLQAKMRSKLTSARFRHLNQTLYTTSSKEALDLFTTSPDLFAEYHAGFSQQVKDSWPLNPVDVYAQSIKERGKFVDEKSTDMSDKLVSLPRRKTGSCTIADLGCGDAPLARSCQSQIKALQLKFHNFDLHASNSHITVADISKLPLRDGEADIAIFCLSLMGTNWINFVEEAWRILRGDGKGELWVAEVKSRFGRITKGRVVENSVGKQRKTPKKPFRNGAEDNDGGVGEDMFLEDSTTQDTDATDISAFVAVFRRRGFMLKEGSVNKSNKMFVSMVFVKSGIPTAGKHKGLKWNGQEYQRLPDGKIKSAAGSREDDVSPEEEAKVLKPCVYKTR